MKVVLFETEKYDKFINSILYFSFFVHQFAFLFGASKLAHDVQFYHSISNMLKIIPFIVMILTAFYYFLRGKFNIKEIIIYVVIAIPLLISLYNYRVVMLISNIFYIIIFKNANSIKCLKIALYASIIGFIFNIIIGYLTHYTGDVGQVRYGIQRIRYGLGFSYAYLTSYFYLTIVLIYILAFNEINVIRHIIFAILGILVFILTDTKAAFVCTEFVLLFDYILAKNKFKIIDILFNFFTIIAFPFSAITAIILPVLYDSNNPVWNKFNQIVNNRLIYAQRVINECGCKLFGQSVGLDIPGYRNIDSSILNMLILNGVIPLIMSVVFMTFFAYIATKTKYKKLMLVLDLIAIRAVFDLGFMSFQLAPVGILFYFVFEKYIKHEEVI